MASVIETMMRADSLRLTARGPDEGETRVVRRVVEGRRLPADI